MRTDINMPFVLNLKGGELELVAKTVMRKKNFKTTNPKLAFEDVSEGRAKKAVAGGKVQKLVTAHGLTYGGKKYKEIDMELVSIDNSSQIVTFNIIHPREIFGNEVKGVQQEVVDRCDIVIEIPQFGTKHSLNISVSAGVIIWDVFSKLKRLNQ